LRGIESREEVKWENLDLSGDPMEFTADSRRERPLRKMREKGIE
jgi:hypothetical protein